MKKPFVIALVIILIFCSLWEVLSRYAEYRFIIPPITAIMSRMWEDGLSLLISNSKVTLREMAGGLVLAAVAAFPLAWMMYLWKSSRLFLQPFFVILQCVPMFTLAPLMILWFGWSYMAIIIPTALMIFFPLTINIYQGLVSTPLGLLDYFKSNQATRWQTFTKLMLPWSLPHIFAGLRISGAFAGIGAIAGEWAGAQSGLGILMLKSRRELDLEMTFGALFCLIFISVSLYSIIAYAENRYKQHKPMKLFSAAIILGLLGLIAFLSTPTGSPVPKNENSLNLLLDWFPNSNHVPIYVGLEKGIFARHGVQLQVYEIKDPSDTIPYLTSGKVDIALFYQPDVIKAKKKGAKVKIIGVLIDQPLNSFLFRTEQKIFSPQDLSGKIIGYSGAASNFSILERLLKENFIVPKELRNVSFDLVTLLGTRQVDIIYGGFWNIEGEHLKSLNIETSHFNVSQLGHPPYSELVFLGREDFKNTRAFQEAMQESINYCKKHAEEAFMIYAGFHPSKSSHSLAWERQAWFKTVPLLAKSQNILKKEEDDLEKWLSN